MLEQLLTHLRNWFEIPNGTYTGKFIVEKGSITLPFLQRDQYFRICGSVFNDGLHQYPTYDLEDEVFDGTVYALAIPKAVVALSKEIKAWQEKNGEAASGPYQSESFGGYSYTKAVDPKTGGAVTWQSAFRARLNPWRKI